jgi:hypothetical protein
VQTALLPITSLRSGLTALLFLCISPLSAQEPAAARQVLIAVETSLFKDAVVNQLADTLARDNPPLLVKRIELNRLATEPIQNYQAVVLINTCRAWRPSSAVREFLKSANDADKKKLVVLTTANSGECNLGVAGVDAISAASKRTGIYAVSQTLVEKVRTRLAAP